MAHANGIVVPGVAVHLFVFYFGILADDTPPVGVAAYAASAISGADPIRTGVQGFIYDLRSGGPAVRVLLQSRPAADRSAELGGRGLGDPDCAHRHAVVRGGYARLSAARAMNWPERPVLLPRFLPYDRAGMAERPCRHGRAGGLGADPMVAAARQAKRGRVRRQNRRTAVAAGARRFQRAHGTRGGTFDIGTVQLIL